MTEPAADSSTNNSRNTSHTGPSAEPLRVGVLGLGAMGLPMAEHLLEAHGSLVVHARTKKRPIIDAGASWADTPRELAEQCDVVLEMLPDLPQLQDMLDGDDGLLAAQTELLLLIGSTSSPVGVQELAADLDERAAGRVRVVDCPVSGGEDGAKAGTLSIMLGGSPEDCEQAASVLSACGRPVRLGPLGAGEVAKACNQLVVASTVLAIGEATVLADRAGLDLQALWDLLSGGYAGSKVLDSRKQQFVDGTDEPSGVAEYMVKDLRFADDVARANDVEPVLLPALRAAFDEIVERGLGPRDITVTRRFVEDRSGS